MDQSPPAPIVMRPPQERLDSWKEIAGYLNRDVTTVQRWEKREGMPVHRHQHDKIGSVYAFRAELDAWSQRRNLRAAQETEKISSANLAPSADEASLSSAPIRKWIWTAFIAAGLIAGLLVGRAAVRRNGAATAADARDRLIIGVTPLQNLSEEPGQDYFVNGLSEEILTELGQLNPARLGVVRYALSAEAIAGEVKLASSDPHASLQYVLEGSVRRDKARARISVRLLRASDGASVWSDSFDRQVDDVLMVESEIAQRIGRGLQVQVLGRASRKPAGPEVMEAYLRGRSEMSKPNLPDTARAYFERAIGLDPAYAPAYAGLADYYCSRAVFNDEGDEQAWQQAQKYAFQALSLDPDSAETHTAIAKIKLMHEWDWRAAREHALRALQLNPSSPDAHATYARYLRTEGNLSEAVNHRKQAVALDPFRPDLRAQLRMEYFFARDFQISETSARQVLEADPKNLEAHVDLCVALGYMKQYDVAVVECGKALELEGRSALVNEYTKTYRTRGFEAARQFLALRDLEELQKQAQPDLWDLANAYVQAGKREEAIRTLFKGLPKHEPGLLQIRVDPDFDSLRSDPRYAELVRQIGFPAEEQ